MEFPAAFFFVNKRLTKHRIKDIRVLDRDLCELHCYQENNCVSFNFKKYPERGEVTHMCELNNSTHLDHDGEFRDDAFYLYKGAKVNVYNNIFLHANKCPMQCHSRRLTW